MRNPLVHRREGKEAHFFFGLQPCYACGRGFDAPLTPVYTCSQSQGSGRRNPSSERNAGVGMRVRKRP